MSYSIKGKTISITRGDSFFAEIHVTLSDGETAYTPSPGDRIRFAMKKNINDAEPLLLKEIPTDTMILRIDPEDTKPLAFGTYVYDIELTKANGVVDTFITKSPISITEEVH